MAHSDHPRIQAAVDRRFNRRKYDTVETVEAFSARLRDQVDLDTLSAELLAVVDQTMQPSQAWLWLDLQPNGEGTLGSEQAALRAGLGWERCRPRTAAGGGRA